MTSINVPDGLQEILKSYVKAAIRSQPEDIVRWSAEYFKTTDERQYTTGTAAIGLRENCKSIYEQDRTLFRILAFQVSIIELHVTKMASVSEYQTFFITT